MALLAMFVLREIPCLRDTFSLTATRFLCIWEGRKRAYTKALPGTGT
jgi:hypothetical protein